MFKKLTQFVFIKRFPENFEKNYIGVMNQVAIWVFFLHIPIFTTIAFFNETGPILAASLTLLTLTGPLIALSSFQSQRMIAVVMGITSMFMGGLLVHFGQGPLQIEMHFYFFVLLALLAVFADPLVIVAAALTATVHHAVVWLVLPTSVFNYDAPFWVVGVHALFVVLESVAACFIARTFFDNINGLEKKADERTAALELRNRDIMTMLDAVHQSFFTIDQELRISEERSGIVDRTFGSLSGMTLPQFLAQFDPAVAEWTEFGMEDVFAQILPIEVTIDQLPKRFSVSENTYSIEYSPVYHDGQLDCLAVVISDVTAAVEKEKLASIQTEMMTMVHRLAEDKSGFLEFFEEASGLVDLLYLNPNVDINLIQRRIHTLKGITGIYRLDRMVLICHEIEEHIEHSGRHPEQAHWDTLMVTWESVRTNFEKIARHEKIGIELSPEEYQELLFDLLHSKSYQEIALKLCSASLEPTDRRLARVGEQAKSLAKRLGKGNIKIKKIGGKLRADAKHWSEFWSAFVHVVRNSVDHGLESPEVREKLGKSKTGTILFKTEIQNGKFVISVRDDGNGINWEKIKNLCEEKGLPNQTQKDLVDAIFSDGLSTRDEVSETSGRGIGLAAIRQVSEELNGKITVESETGVGTAFSFTFPLETLAPELFQLLNAYNIPINDSNVSQLCGVRRFQEDETTPLTSEPAWSNG